MISRGSAGEKNDMLEPMEVKFWVTRKLIYQCLATLRGMLSILFLYSLPEARRMSFMKPDTDLFKHSKGSQS